MSDIKAMVARNIAILRQARGMTQLELAEKLSYSDKAVSKWERAESMPDISVLVEIADLFDVSMDALVRGEQPTQLQPAQTLETPPYRRGVISVVSILLVWLLAVLGFVAVSLLIKGAQHTWLAFIYALPVSMIVWLVFNSIWFRPRLNYLIVSLLMWTVLLSVHLSLLMYGINVWMLYLLGVPGQLILLLWPAIRRTK